MVETVAKNWAQGYDFPAVTEGKVIKKTFPYGGVYGMQGFVFNLRRPIFQDRRIRQALGYAFDFDWMSFAYFFGQYQRSLSFFNNSELEAKGLPSVVERDLLDPLRPEISSEIFNEITSKEFTLPQTGRDEWKLRENLLEAKRLLEEAGCYFKDKKLMLPGSNEPFRFTLLIDDFAWARIASSWARNLRRLGIEMEYQVLDTSIFENRLRSFDFDTILYIWGGNMLPGDELRNQWGSAAADIPGSENISGLKSLAVDQLIEQITAAKTYSDLVTRVRVLDRLLNSSYLVVPHWYMKFTRVAFWDKFGFPEKTPLKGVQFDTWWIKDEYAEISENQKN